MSDVEDGKWCGCGDCFADDDECQGECGDPACSCTDEIVRAKWTMDGARTLEEAAVLVRGFANHLDDLHQRGFFLREAVVDDYGFIYHPDGTKAYHEVVQIEPDPALD